MEAARLREIETMPPEGRLRSSATHLAALALGLNGEAACSIEGVRQPVELMTAWRVRWQEPAGGR